MELRCRPLGVLGWARRRLLHATFLVLGMSTAVARRAPPLWLLLLGGAALWVVVDRMGRTTSGMLGALGLSPIVVLASMVRPSTVVLDSLGRALSAELGSLRDGGGCIRPAVYLGAVGSTGEVGHSVRLDVVVGAGEVEDTRFVSARMTLPLPGWSLMRRAVPPPSFLV